MPLNLLAQLLTKLHASRSQEDSQMETVLLRELQVDISKIYNWRKVLIDRLG